MNAPVASRAEWLSARRLFLGASEVAAVIGCDPNVCTDSASFVADVSL